MTAPHRRRGDISGRALLLAALTILAVAAATTGVVVLTPPRHVPQPISQPSIVSHRPIGPVDGHRHNIVMIVTDDMRTDELAYLPHVQQLLVDRGTWFTHAISPHPLCCPARAELMTGEYAQNNGVHHNTGPYGGYPALLRPDDNIGRWLQHAGYYTAFVGKYLNSYTGQRRIAGWTSWKAAVHYVYDYDRVQYYGGPILPGYVAGTTTRYTDRAIRAGHHSHKPFYVVANYLAPHDEVIGSQVSLPIPALGYDHTCDGIRPRFRFDPAYLMPTVNGLPASMSSYRRSLSRLVAESHDRICALRSVDDGVAHIVDTLLRTGELADTDIVFVSDNGFNLGEHDLHGKNWLTDESLDVPIVATGPDFPVGVRSSVPVSLVDLPATYLRIAGATAGRPQDGLSLLDVLGSPQPLRDTLLVQTGDNLDDSSPGFAFRGVTTPRYLYAVDPSDPSSGLLFDRQRDPHSLENRFFDLRYADIKSLLQRRLDALESCSGADCNQVFGPLPEPHP